MTAGSVVLPRLGRVEVRHSPRSLLCGKPRAIRRKCLLLLASGYLKLKLSFQLIAVRFQTAKVCLGLGQFPRRNLGLALW